MKKDSEKKWPVSKSTIKSPVSKGLAGAALHGTASVPAAGDGRPPSLLSLVISVKGCGTCSCTCRSCSCALNILGSMRHARGRGVLYLVAPTPHRSLSTRSTNRQSNLSQCSSTIWRVYDSAASYVWHDGSADMAVVWLRPNDSQCGSRVSRSCRRRRRRLVGRCICVAFMPSILFNHVRP
jgi:hypothetical protein